VGVLLGATKTRECSGHNEAAIGLPPFDRSGSLGLNAIFTTICQA
jgi:hypothetical protein